MITPLSEFRELGKHHRVVPVTAKVLGDGETPMSIYRAIAHGRPGAFLLESASQGSWQRYSFVGRNPLSTLTAQRGGELAWQGTVPAGAPTGGDPLEGISQVLSLLKSPPPVDLPPMTSSLVGYVGWDAVRRFEKLGDGPDAVTNIPEIHLSIPGDLVVFDHYTAELTLVANVLNADGSPERIEQAYENGRKRIDAMLRDLNEQRTPVISTLEWPAPTVRSHTEHEDFLTTVETAKEHIRRGDVFQVVPGQRFESDTSASALDIYRVLRRTNPSSYMYLLEVENSEGEPFSIIGSSPEALVTVKDREVLTHPIAGSRPRGNTEVEDRRLAEELIGDAKERSEHIMLVDLARNDLAKVCQPGTVDVSEFMEIARYSHIMHIESTVTGTLRDEVDGMDVIRAAFPAGTLSGAPKPRALQLIDELEPIGRGLYGGVVGYLSFAGDLDMAIAIRTGVLKDGVIAVYAGAGVVADSVPESEYQETRTKAASVLNSAAAAQTLRAAVSVDDLEEQGERE